MKPEVHKDSSEDWRFNFPEQMESVMDDYYNSVEQIDYDEDLAQMGRNKIIKKFPDCHIDAYNHLRISSRNQDKTEEALQYALTAYIAKNSSSEPPKSRKSEPLKNALQLKLYQQFQ